MNHKLIPLFAALLAGSVGAQAFESSAYAAHSRMASGKWVKIKTTREGIYQLTAQQLEDLGFDDPSSVWVYGYGAPTLTSTNSSFDRDFPDDMVAVAVNRTPDGRILFYGQADAYIRSGSLINYSSNDSFDKVRSPYDTASYYFLSDVEPDGTAPEVPKAALNPNLAPLESHIHVDFIEPEVQNPSNGGTVFHGPVRKAGDRVDYTFTIKDYQPYSSSQTEAGGSFYYQYGIRNTASTKLAVTLPSELTLILANDGGANQLDPSSRVQFLNATGRHSFKYADGGAGKSADLTFSVEIPAGSATYAAEDFVMLRYARANRLDAESPFLVMNFPSNYRPTGQSVVFPDIAEGDLQVWSLDGYVPAVFQVTYADGQASILLNGAVSSAVAFRPSYTFDSPEIVGEVPNQDIHGRAVPDMVIITVADMKAEALELAEIHRQYQGMDVFVAVHDDIYNEFSSGARDAMAYRRMAKMFYDRDPQKFKHLMFLGPTSYDNRSVSNVWADRLVCYEQDDPELAASTITNYAADVYFGMLSDTYKHSDIQYERCQINVGRVSCLSPGQAATYVRKVRDRFENPLPAEVYNHMIVSAGEGDNTTHSKQANELIDNVRAVNGGIAVSPIYVEAYSKSYSNEMYDCMAAMLNRGAGFMGYIGHGASISIASWNISKAATTRYRYPTFVMFSSCDQFAFDHSHNGLTETMMLLEEGGALGGVAAVRSVFIDQNQKTAVPVSVAYAAAKYGDTFGDVFRRSRDMLLDDYAEHPSNYSVPLTSFRNVLAYNLAGDPALPIGVPEYTATIDRIGDNEASGPVEVAPFTPTRFSGRILSGDEQASAFNGTVRIEIHDGQHSMKTNNVKNESPYTPNTITFDSEVLAIGYGSVTDGAYDVDMSVPLPAYVHDKYNVVVSALSDGGNAFGQYGSLSIGSYDADSFEQEEFDAPEILELYADDPTFESGDETSALITVYGVVNPSSSGLNAMTAGIATRTRLTVDGTSPSSDLEGCFTRLDDGNLMLTVPMSELSDGTHTIELCVANNAGLVARRSIEVIVTHRNLAPEVTVEETPATYVATIDVTGGEFQTNRLVIADASGATVFTKPNVTFPYRWDLKDTDGNAVADGLYKVSVLVQNDRDYGSTPSTEVIVLRKVETIADATE